MKNSLLLCLFFLLPWGSRMYAQGNDDSATKIEVSQAGTLKEKLEGHKNDQNIEITGDLNATDLFALRALTQVQTLDLSQASVVAGGEYDYHSQHLTGMENKIPEGLFFGVDASIPPIAKTLQSLSLPTSVTVIGERAFQNFSALTEVNLPEDLTEIGAMAFGYCTSLEGIELPDGLITIGDSAFSHCSALSDIEIPESVKQLGGGAFEHCTSLSSCKIESLNIKKISFATFKGCVALSDFKIPELVDTIGKWAFMECKSLKELQMPLTLKFIENSAFEKDSALTTVIFPSNGLKRLGDGAFKSCISLTTIALPSSCTYIGPFAFQDCKALQSIELPAKLDTIMGGAFVNTGLTSVYLPNSLKQLSYAAFAKNTALTKVVMTCDGLKKFSDKAFGSCPNIDTLLITFSQPLTQKSNSELEGVKDLSAINNIKLIVPTGAKDAFRKAPLWSDFNAITEGISKEVTLTEDKHLASFITEEEAPMIFSLKIIGPITADDYELIEKCTSLVTLDLKNATLPADYDGQYIPRVNLQNVILPDNLTKIPDSFMANYPTIKNITVSKNLKTIGENAFSSCGAVENLELPMTVNSIGESAFDNMGMLKDFKLPDSLSVIANFLFRGCASLEEMNIPNGVGEIGEYGFFNAAGLTKVTISNTLNEIKDYAFLGCSALKAIYFKTRKADDEPITLDEKVFEDAAYDNVTLYFTSQEQIDMYKEADEWSNFKNWAIYEEKEVNPPARVNVVEQTPAIELINTGNGLRIMGKVEGEIKVYTINGYLTRSIKAKDGIFIALEPGIYLLRVNHHTFKTIVK